MQKKYFSLLATAPIVFTAAAHENVPFSNLLKVDPGNDNWIYGGVTYTTNGDNTVYIETASSVGTITLDVLKAYWDANNENLPKGDYKIDFGVFMGDKDGIGVKPPKLLVNGEVVDNGYIFNYNGKGKFEIGVQSGGEAASFTFGDGKLTLQCNFEAIANSLQNSLNDVTYTELTEQNPASEEYTALQGERNTLEEERAGIQSEINEISANDKDDDYYISIYSKYELWNGEESNTVVPEIQDFGERVNQYNEDVTAENDRYQQQLDNLATYNSMNEDISNLETNVNELKGKIADNEYIIGLIGEDLETILSQITSYKYDLYVTFHTDGAIKDGEIDTETLETRYAKLEEDYNTANETYNKASSDQTAYAEWDKLYHDLIAAQNNANSTFAETAKNNSVYKDWEEEYTNNVDYIATEAIDTCGIKVDVIAGAADRIEADKETINEAIEKINSDLEKFKEDVETQDGYKAAADKVLGDLQNQLDEQIIPDDIPKDVKDALEAQKKAIKDKIDGKRTSIKELYQAHGLNKANANLYTFKDLIEGSISDLSKAIEKAKDDAKEYQKIKEANDNFVAVVTTKFEVLKDLIKETFPKGTELYGKFDPSIDNMESDINAFKKDVDEMTQKGIDVDGSVNHEEYIEFTDWQYNLLKNIDEVSKIVTSVAADYEAIKDNLKTMQGEVDNFQTAYDGKEVVMDGDTPLVDKEQILGNALSGLQKTIGDFETGLKEVSGESNLILQQQIASLKTEVEGRVETFKDDVESAILAFSKAVTEENNKVAQKERTAALAAASAFENPTEIPGGTEMLTDFNALVKEGTDLQNSLSKAESAENYDALDPDCQALYDHAKALNDYADKLKANNDAYSTLTTEAAAVQAEIDTVREWLDANTQENAKSFYNGKLDVLQSQLDAINEQIETAYKEINLAENQDNINEQLAVIKSKASTVKSDAELNEEYHNAQCSEFNSLTSRYEYVRDYIDTNDELPEDKAARLAELEEQKARIDTLETTIATAYDNGESKAKDTEIDETYQEILVAINAIDQSMRDEYAQKVIENNNKVLNDTKFGGNNWAGWYSELDKEYNKAVRTYERYHNSLLNAGYKTFVGDILENHNDIIKYIAEIRQLKIDVKEYIDELNNKAEVLTEETLKEIAIDPAQQIIDKINAAVDEMKSAFNEKAQEYWESNYDDKLTQLTAIITSLRDAGVNESIIKEYTRDVSDELEQARLLYNAHKDGDLSPWMGAQIVNDKIVAGGIADMLDKIDVSIDTKGAANAQWTEDLTEAEQTLQTYRDNLDSYGRLSDEEKAGYTAQYDEIQNRINELDEEAKSSEDLLENLRDFADELNSIMDDATAIDTEAKALQDGREGEQAAHDGFVADLESASQRLEALRDWVDGMAIEYDNDFSPISREIENLRTKVENSDLTSSEVKDEITNDITELNSMIDSAYQNCYDQERAALNNLLTLSELALNRYKAENEFTSDEVAEYYSRIDKVKNDINALSDDLTIIDSEEVRTELLGLQNTLVKLISDIEEARRNLHPDITNPLQDALNALNSRYEEINSTLAGLLNGKTESVAEEYQSQVEALENELNDVKAAYENEGNNLFATESTYNNALDKISAKAAELQKAINDAQAAYEQELERQAASDAAAANLQQQIDGFRTELNSLKSFVVGAGMYPNVEFEFNNLVAYAEGRINAMQTWLDEEKEKYALTSESVLPNATTLTDFLNQATGMYVIMESGYQVDRARTAVDQTALLVVGQKHNNQEELDAKLAALEARVNDLKAASTVEAVAALTEEVNSIVEAAEALADEAIENAFIVGDINGDGEVTAVDLQALLNIIKEEDITPDDSRFNTLNINKDDAVDVVDAVALANMIIGESAEQVRARIMACPAENPTVAIQAVETEADNGTRTILIDLTNSVDFVAGQFDLKLPAGMQILSEDLTDRTDGMMLLTNSLPDGRYRVILFSEQLSDMEGNEGSILELKVVGNGNIYVNNAVFGDRFGHSYEGTDPGTTGIDGILNSAKDGAQKIYDAAGRMVNKIQKGINVIVNGKGKGKKVIGRK